MAEKKRVWKEEEKKYQRDYIKENLIYIRFSLNKNKPEDMKMYEHLTSLGDRKKTQYIKDLIWNDMQKEP